MSDRMVLKILGECDSPEGKKYLIEWTNHRKEWSHESNINPYTIQIYRQIRRYNEDICSDMENPKTAFVYCRSSLNETEINTQKELCVSYCRDKNFPLDYLALDTASGRHMKNLESELGAFEKHLDNTNVIVVSSPEVLGKDIMKVTSFLYNMKKRNIDVHIVKLGIIWNKETKPEEMFEVRDVLNKVELESDRKSNYYREELRKMKKKGHRTGKPPFGMKAKKIAGIRKFVEDKKEQKIISRIMVLHKNSINYKMISEIMKQEGLVDENRMLENPTFIKRIVSKQKQIITSVNKCLEGMKL